MFPVQAIDGEDTRFFPSQHTNLCARVGDAFLHTIWRHDDSGGMMPAYSEFLGDYGAAAVSRMWWPKSCSKGRSIPFFRVRHGPDRRRNQFGARIHPRREALAPRASLSRAPLFPAAAERPIELHH